jgi:small subunit ribosomal protein S24e
MSSEIVIRARKFQTNKLLDRKQFVVDVFHKEVGDVSLKMMTKELAKKFKVSEDTVVLFGFRTIFGGGKSTGFCLIYDSLDSLKKFEPKHRLFKSGVLVKSADAKKKTRRMKKEEKNKVKDLRGKAKKTGGADKKKKK